MTIRHLIGILFTIAVFVASTCSAQDVADHNEAVRELRLEYRVAAAESQSDVDELKNQLKESLEAQYEDYVRLCTETNETDHRKEETDRLRLLSRLQSAFVEGRLEIQTYQAEQAEIPSMVTDSFF